MENQSFWQWVVWIWEVLATGFLTWALLKLIMEDEIPQDNFKEWDQFDQTWKDYPEASYSRTLSSTKRSRCFNSAFSIVLCADFIFGLYLVTFYSIELLFQQQTKG